MSRFVVFLLSALLFASCSREEAQRGFPRYVEFNENGDMITISGDECFRVISMHDGGDVIIGYFMGYEETDTMQVRNDWLRAYQVGLEPKLVLIASPLDDSVEKRSVTLYGDFGDAYATISVTQKKNK
jgi:hypothetical protein